MVAGAANADRHRSGMSIQTGHAIPEPSEPSNETPHSSRLSGDLNVEKGQLIKIIIIAVCLLGASFLIITRVLPTGGGSPTVTNEAGESVPAKAPRP